jgi:hypothetical protein
VRRPLGWFANNVIATVPLNYPGRRPAGLSGLPAARRVPVDEPREPHAEPLRDVQAPDARRPGKRRGARSGSTTSTCRSAT